MPPSILDIIILPFPASSPAIPWQRLYSEYIGSHSSSFAFFQYLGGINSFFGGKNLIVRINTKYVLHSILDDTIHTKQYSGVYEYYQTSVLKKIGLFTQAYGAKSCISKTLKIELTLYKRIKARCYTKNSINQNSHLFCISGQFRKFQCGQTFKEIDVSKNKI